MALNLGNNSTRRPQREKRTKFRAFSPPSPLQETIFSFLIFSSKPCKEHQRLVRSRRNEVSTVKIRAHRSTRSHRPKQVGQSGVAPSTPRGPPLPPRQECGSAQPERCVSRLFLGHFLNEAEGLCAPPSSRLECDNHETTPLCCDEVGIYGFLSGRLHQRQHSGEEHRNKSTRFWGAQQPTPQLARHWDQRGRSCTATGRCV